MKSRYIKDAYFGTWTWRSYFSIFNSIHREPNQIIEFGYGEAALFQPPRKYYVVNFLIYFPLWLIVIVLARLSIGFEEFEWMTRSVPFIILVWSLAIYLLAFHGTVMNRTMVRRREYGELIEIIEVQYGTRLHRMTLHIRDRPYTITVVAWKRSLQNALRLSFPQLEGKMGSNPTIPDRNKASDYQEDDEEYIDEEPEVDGTVDSERGKTDNRAVCSVCGAWVVPNAPFCPCCGARVQQVINSTLHHKTMKPAIGGVLLILGGAFSLLVFTIVITDDSTGFYYTTLDAIEAAVIFTPMIMAIISVAGGILSCCRKFYPMALFGGVCGVLNMGAVLAIPGTILIFLSRREFPRRRVF